MSRCRDDRVSPRSSMCTDIASSEQPTIHDGLWPRRRVKSWKPVIRAANGRRWPPWCSFRGGAWCCVTSDCVRVRLRYRVGAYGTCGCRVRHAASCIDRVNVPRQRRRYHHRCRRCQPRPRRGRGNTDDTRGRDVSFVGRSRPPTRRGDSRARCSHKPSD